MDTVLQVSEINLPVIQQEIITLQEQITELIEYIKMTNTILLYVMAVGASAFICILLYKFLKIFF